MDEDRNQYKHAYTQKSRVEIHIQISLLHVEPPHKYRKEIERKKSRTHTSDIHILENFKEYITLLAPEFTDLWFPVSLPPSLTVVNR